ncbi:hypothetical protein MHA_1787 [Mannheimia haemolytica PHL213]|nr:hypothetical protein MHA_1787 [Mannheimia haemolytica PHL213]
MTSGKIFYAFCKANPNVCTNFFPVVTKNLLVKAIILYYNPNLYFIRIIRGYYAIYQHRK